MIKDLQDILNIGVARNLAKEVVEEYDPNHQPRFKTTEDLKEYLISK